MSRIPALLVLLFSSDLVASDHADLTAKIAALDAELFEAFNTCDVETNARFFADDLEFFHDIVGLGGKEQTLASSRSNCGSGLGLERTLIEDSLRVFPIPGYGAIQEGRHRFCHPTDQGPDCGTFNFLHIWREGEDGSWQLTRVVSYGH
ncbi:MAG: nuclear transport factor 2 family protein [Pseudomonadota bacterium]